MKAERANPGGSIKDRIGLSMVEDAERRGVLGPDSTIVEPTSGNTGVGLAIVAAVRGYKLILVMPESMSLERRRLMAAYGAQVELTPREGGMTAAIARANELVAADPRRVDPAAVREPGEHRDPPRQHRAGDPVATSRTASTTSSPASAPAGTSPASARSLKEHFPALQTFAVEPAKSPVISGGDPSPHRLQGIGAGFVPANLHAATLDGVIQVSEEDAYAYAVRAAREEGIFVGPSSGASLAAVAQKLPEIPDGSTVLTFCYDTGERYFSVEGLFSADGTSVQVGARPAGG